MLEKERSGTVLRETGEGKNIGLHVCNEQESETYRGHILRRSGLIANTSERTDAGEDSPQLRDWNKLGKMHYYRAICSTIFQVRNNNVRNRKSSKTHLDSRLETHTLQPASEKSKNPVAMKTGRQIRSVKTRLLIESSRSQPGGGR